MMEIGAAFSRVLNDAKKELSRDAKDLGARWLRGRIESSTKLRWNPVRKKALEVTVKVATYAVRNSGGATITADELAAAIRQMTDGFGKLRMEECPF
jgi:hypothetical protein